MIIGVTHTAPVNDKIRISEIEFAVPADGKNGTVTYHKKVTFKSAKVITINVDED